MPWENGMLVPSPEQVAAYEEQMSRGTVALYDDDGNLAAPVCAMPCEDDCPPNHKPDWRDPAACDERAASR